MPRAASAAARTAPAPRRRSAAPARRPSRPAAVPRKAIRVVPRGGSRPAAAVIGAGVLDRLLRGRAWIACIGALLAGVVFLNVSLLEINRGITQKAERTAQLKRDNAQLRLRVAGLASSERIQETAAARGFVLPAPADIDYLEPGRRDAAEAAERVTVPTGTPAPAPQPQSEPATDTTAPAQAAPETQQPPPPAQQQAPVTETPPPAAETPPAAGTGAEQAPATQGTP